MTISNAVRTAGPYTGNGVTTVFPFGFKVFLASDVVAVRSDGTTQTTLVLNTDYTVSLNVDQDSTPGGSITTIGTPLSSSYTLTLTSNVAQLQGASLQNQGGFYPKVIENALDRAVILIQQLSSIVNRTLRFPLSDTGTNTELPTKANRINKLLSFDANGNPVAVAPSDQSASSVSIQLANHIAILASAAGPLSLGFQQTGIGAILETLYSTGINHLNGKNFGMVADWNGTTGTNNTSKLLAALTELKTRGGGVLTINPGDYYFGDYATSAEVVTIVGLSNAKIVAHGARFILNSTADNATPFLLTFDTPNNVVLEGASFLDIGFNPASWQTHSRWGMAAVLLKAASVCSGFTMRDCVADNLTYLLVSDLRTQKRNLSNITVTDCRVTNAYYGVDVLYVGDNLKIDNLVCKDVRRGLIGYGMKNFDVDIKLYTSSGFLGSNAFISIASEGETYNDGNGVIGTEANVRDGRIKLNVSGFEAHSAYVHFYHQQADSVGYISNIDSHVYINNLSAAGKNALVGNTDVYLFDHELPNASVIGTTTRTCKQIKLDASILGTITGLPIRVNSSNPSNPFSMSLSPNLTRLAHTYSITQFTNDTDFITPFDKPLTSLTPVGATTAGTVTGLVSNGSWCQIGKRVFFNTALSWTGHTGTGQLRLNGLPKPLDTTRGSLSATISVGDGLAHTANTSLQALIGGTGNNQILIYEDNGGALANVNVDPTVNNLLISGSYVTP